VVGQRIQPGKGTPIVRYDEWGRKYAIHGGRKLLKIDCENMSADAVAGFGLRLQDFSMAVIEVIGDDMDGYGDQHQRIHEQMKLCGFNKATLVDAGYGVDGIGFCDVAFWR
jgi:hypothetical protein